MRASAEPVSVPENGVDVKFRWKERGIEQSLERGGLGRNVLAALKSAADDAGVLLLVYETPAPKNADAPMVYPIGFYELYQKTMMSALSEIGVPYLDLSNTLPWTGAAMVDFVHPVGSARPLIHKMLLAWLFDPEALRQSGLVRPNTVPAITPASEWQ